MQITEQVKLDVWIPEGENDKALIHTIEVNVTKNGGRILGCGSTPAGWNVFGSAPEPVVQFLEQKSKEFGFTVDRNGETMQRLLDEEMAEAQ